MDIKLFYSKSKDIKDLDLGRDIGNWRRVLSNFHNIEITMNGRKYQSVEHYLNLTYIII